MISSSHGTKRFCEDRPALIKGVPTVGKFNKSRHKALKVHSEDYKTKHLMKLFVMNLWSCTFLTLFYLEGNLRICCANDLQAGEISGPLPAGNSLV